MNINGFINKLSFKNNNVFSLYFSVIPALYEMILFVGVFGFKRKPLWGFLHSWFRRILSFHDWRTRISWNQNNIHWHNKLVFSMRLLRRVLRLLNYVWRLFDGFMWLQITALNFFLENITFCTHCDELKHVVFWYNWPTNWACSFFTFFSRLHNIFTPKNC